MDIPTEGKIGKDTTAESLESHIYDHQHRGLLGDFGRYAFYPENSVKGSSEERVTDKAQQIFDWAQKNGVDHYSFLSFPHSSGICEKQESFLDISYHHDGSRLKSIPKMVLLPELLLKGEADGSSFPSGGLR